MPRTKAPNRLDQIADAATETFIQYGFGPAKIAQVAHVARVGPGTIYLYAAGKEALFDLALRRALEDPTVWSLPLPHPAPEPGAVADALWRCLQNASHFPQLWLAAESPPPREIRAEVEGILRELYRWLYRYRRAIKLVERCAADWPEVSQMFFRRFWRGGIRRLADYLKHRRDAHALPAGPDHLASAHLVVESLAWMAAHREWTPDASLLPAQVAEETAVALWTRALTA